MSEQRAPSKTPTQPADDSPSPTEASKRAPLRTKASKRAPLLTEASKRQDREREATYPGQSAGQKEGAYRLEGADQEEGGHAVEKLVGVQRGKGTGWTVQKTRREAKKSDGGGSDKVERGEKPVGVGGDGGGAAEGNGQGREAVVPGVAVALPAVAPPAVAPPADRRDASTQRDTPDQAAMEEILALRAQLAALAANSEQQAAVTDALRQQLASGEREKEDLRRAAADAEALRQQLAQAAAGQESYRQLVEVREGELRREVETIQAALNAQREAGIRAAREEQAEALQAARDAQATAERQLGEERQRLQQQLQNAQAMAERQQQAQSEAEQRLAAQLESARQAQAAAERQRDETAEAARNAQAAAERQRVAEAEAARAELTRALQAAHNALVATERQRDEMIAAAEQALSDVRQRDQELQVLRDRPRSPAPNADQGVVPGGGEEDEDGGGEELPRMASPGAAYVAEVAEGQIPNDIGPLARVIETDPRWRPGRREDFEDTPNIESIERRRYNRSAGNVLYETNFPIGQFASVRVPMPRGTPQTLALFGRNAHVATPAQSFNRAIMRYEGRGVYR